MAADLDEVQQEQRRTWDRFADGWQRWNRTVQAWLSPVADVMIRGARLGDRSVVLDVATGTGEPGLSVAALIPHGRVVLSDLAEHMLGIASTNAAERGLTNIETRIGGAGALPFPDESFDAVLCRFGFMFFPDMAAAATELARVTRPGGRVSVAVWAQPETNPWATVIMGTIADHVPSPTPPPDSPGLFRCASEGLMRDVLGHAGFRDLIDEEVPCPLLHDSPEEYWQFMTEVAAPVVAGLARTDQATQTAIRDLVCGEARKFLREGRVTLPATARVVSGTR